MLRMAVVDLKEDKNIGETILTRSRFFSLNKKIIVW